MPHKVLHCLFNVDEEREIRVNGFGLDTHGIQHVVLQFERGRKPGPKHNGHAIALPAPTKAPQVRNKTDKCRFCKKPTVPQGTWKHEKYCEKNPRCEPRKGAIR